MKHLLRILGVLILVASFTHAQEARIVIEPVTPHQLESLGLDVLTNSVSAGLKIVPKGTYIYLSAEDIDEYAAITNATFTLPVKPSGSTAAITPFNDWVYFMADMVGEYQINLSITTASGTDDTTMSVYGAEFVGVGNFAGVAATFPQCMTCHGGNPTFTDIYARWEVSGHANIFNQQLSTSTHYSTSCMKCHTTGYDHNVAAANNGFDDVAASLGWTFAPPTSPAKWDSLVNFYPGLANFATIGCEMCHGAGNQHTQGGVAEKIQVTLDVGSCAQCHDEPWRHNRYAQYENSLHAEALWSGSFAQGASSQNNSLSNCIRCHDGVGFVNFTKGLTTNTTGMRKANQTHITCATCHDPHGNDNEYALRDTPVGSDTLGNGFAYTAFGGKGQTCMNCHKGRRDMESYTAGGVTSSHWGPHHSTQTDVLLGMNVAEFGGGAYLSSSHKYAVGDACVDCHMYATVDTGNVNRDKVGQHSFKLYNPDTDYYHTPACESCHGPKTSWDDFQATADYDGDGTIESIPQEIAGLETLLRIALPPTGVDDVDWQQIQALNVLSITQAYWNYMVIAYDGSKGMHNAKFAIDVLTRTIEAIGGVIPVELMSFSAEISGKYVDLKWETATETNNYGFEIERKVGDSWFVAGFVDGAGNSTSPKVYSFRDDLSTRVKSGTITYRIKQIDFDGKTNYSKEVEVEYTGGPSVYALSQNYPNPFNPTTTIEYSLPFDSNVKLTVFNITGEVVTELVNTVQSTGYHKAQFNMNSGNLASGIYFYNLEATSVDGTQSFTKTMKMLLLK